MNKPSAQFINPQDTGLRGLELKRPVFDADAVDRAEQALDALTPSMEDWLDRDVEKLQAARQSVERMRGDAACLEALLFVAHDLRGMGSTYGYPLISQLAHSLCRLVEASGGDPDHDSGRRRAKLIGVHVDAIRAAASARSRDASHPVGQALLAELQTHVAKLAPAES